MFVPVHGTQFDESRFRGSTLVLPSQCIGLSAYIGMELFILNTSMERVGFYKSDYVSPIVVNDNMTLPGQPLGQVQMPAEVYFSAEHNMTFLMIRSGPTGGMRRFADELVAFIMSTDFAKVVILTATGSPVSRERDSNRHIPEVFAYCNNFMFRGNRDYYNQNGIRKFGYWIQDVKRRPHQELAELSAAGWADRLMKSFNRMEKPAILFTIFCPGAIDFVGGYNYFQFLKQNMFGNPAEQTTQRLGRLTLSTAEVPLETGEQIHELLFLNNQDRVKIPQGWIQAANYF